MNTAVVNILRQTEILKKEIGALVVSDSAAPSADRG
jgi:hypothetical protein